MYFCDATFQTLGISVVEIQSWIIPVDMMDSMNMPRIMLQIFKAC